MRTTLAAMAVAVALSLPVPTPAQANPSAAVVQQLVEGKLAHTARARARLVKLYQADPQRLRRFLANWYRRVQHTCAEAKVTKAKLKQLSGSSLRGQQLRKTTKFRTCASGYVRRNWQRFTRSIPEA